MKKIILTISLFFLTFTLVSCKQDFFSYAGTYTLETQLFYTEDNKQLFPFDFYEIELTSKGDANHRIRLELMSEEDNYTNTYTVNEEEGLIHFRHVLGFMQNYTETWDYDGKKITMTGVLVANNDNPDPENEEDYISGTIILVKI